MIVMYAGEVMERADRRTLFYDNHHPYTEGLLQSLPAYGGERERLLPIAGPAAQPDQPAAGLPVPPALPVRHGPLPDRGARARAGRRRRDAPVGLLAAARHAARRPQGRRRTARSRGVDDATVGGKLSNQPVATVDRPATVLRWLRRDACSEWTSRSVSRRIQSLFSGKDCVHAVDGVSLEVRRGRDPRPGRRDRLRQVDPGPLHHAAVRPHLRHDRSSTAEDISTLSRRKHAPVPPRHADDLPGPVRLAEPAPPGRVDHRRPVRDPRHRRAARTASSGSRRSWSWSGSTRSTTTGSRPSSPAASASASAWPGPWPSGPKLIDLRRAGVRPGRVDPGPDHQPAGRPAGASSASPTSSSPTTCRWSGT